MIGRYPTLVSSGLTVLAFWMYNVQEGIGLWYEGNGYPNEVDLIWSMNYSTLKRPFLQYMKTYKAHFIKVSTLISQKLYVHKYI